MEQNQSNQDDVQIISLQVNRQTAEAFKKTSQAERERLADFLSIFLSSQNQVNAKDNFEQAMDRMGNEAQSNGLSIDKLGEIVDA